MADRYPTRPSDEAAREAGRRLSPREGPARARGGTTPNSPIDIEVDGAGEPAVAIGKAEDEALAKSIEKAKKGTA